MATTTPERFGPSANGKGQTMPAPCPRPYEACYDAGRGMFWAKNAKGEWVQYTRTDLFLHLRAAGFSKALFNNMGLHQVEQEIYRLQMEHDVHYAGQLAGYDQGMYEVCGQRFLVTRGPRRIQKKRIPWDTIKQFLEGLLGPKKIWFDAWLKAGIDSMAAGPPFRPGQLLALVGPSGVGKNLLQDIVTEMFGGRMSSPFRYMEKATPFNSELLEAEHLQISDEAASTDLRTRRIFGAMIKNMTVNRKQSLHAKNRSALTVTPFWRMTLSCNDDPEHLLVLPPLDESLLDKIILLEARKHQFPFDSNNFKGQKKFWDAIVAELPGYCFYLGSWKIPKTMQDPRYGVRAFQETRLMKEINEMSPEWKFLSLFDCLELLRPYEDHFEGTQTEIEKAMREADRTGEVGRILTWSNACGTYLGRLAKKAPSRVQRKRGVNNTRVWIIKRVWKTELPMPL